MARSLRHLSVAGALFVCGCSLPADGFRTDGHAQASGPCWEVDIGNGLDPDSATEIQSLFACIDRRENESVIEREEEGTRVSN